MSFQEDTRGFANREEEIQEHLKRGDLVEHKGAYYVERNGYLYPVGTEPDEDMTPEELRVARAKETGWVWTVRFGLLGILIIIVLVIGFALTK